MEGTTGAPRPTKVAYRYVRAVEGWTSSPIGNAARNEEVEDEEGTTGSNPDIFDEISTFVPDDTGVLAAPLCEQANVDEQTDTWAERWETEKAYQHPTFNLDLDMFIGLAAELIPIAAMTFPGDTGLGHDNFSPRAVSRLSPAAINALAELFIAFEKFGEWADALDLVLIVLLPKNDGGYRPIGLFPTIIRIWFRTRLLTIKIWDQSNKMPSVFGGPGMGAQKAAFQISITAEIAALENADFAAGLLDLVKAFETVPHHILVSIAIALGYPLPLLRLCLASYRLKRSIGIEGVYSKTVVATRGITAGSGTAATELKLLLLPLMRMLEEQWANSLVAKVYVDDLTLLVRGGQADGG